MDASQIVLTAEGRQKLVEELAWREGDYAKEIVEDIKEARAFGDLSENSEYDAAKDKQAQNAARIADLCFKTGAGSGGAVCGGMS